MSPVVRRALPQEATLVSSVLGEADAWLRTRGERLWQTDELAPETIGPEVAAGLYYVALIGTDATGVLRLTLDDPLFWPEATAGEALSLGAPSRAQ